MFCGVKAQHQNAIVERKMEDLTITGRTLLSVLLRTIPTWTAFSQSVALLDEVISRVLKTTYNR